MPTQQVVRMMNQAVRLHQAGRLAEAEAIYQQVLKIDPRDADALNLLGTVATQTGRNDAAIQLMSQAVAIRPQADFYVNLGQTLAAVGREDEAYAAYQAGLKLDPKLAELHNNLGSLLSIRGDKAGATQSFSRALELRPTYATALCNLGHELRDQWRLDEAEKAYRRTLELKPNSADALDGLGALARNDGNIAEAIRYRERALAINPTNAEYHANLAVALLLAGDWQRGWDEYEWRWKSRGHGSKLPAYPKPLWTGQEIAGRTILLYGEQGLGDTLQFVRYVPMIAARGVRVILQPQSPLLTGILSRVAGVMKLTSEGEPLPPFDYHCPLLSLPRLFKTTPQSATMSGPYLSADPGLVQQWEKRLGTTTQRRVGLVWAGSALHKNDRNRSMPLEALNPLLLLPNIQFYSLQKGPAARQLNASPLCSRIIDLDAELTDFDQTAAALMNLDLLISVDTSLVHLAGGLGRSVWMFNPFIGDWRWLQSGDTSAWYPALKIFRQTRSGDWTEPVAQVVKDLL
jgi:Flp pilus assembly protein TadD